MEHLIKSFEMKANEVGEISGFFSTYEKTPDSYGDIIESGAFTGTLERRKATGHPFPLCFNHDFDKIIGVVDSVEEKENGPFIKAHFLDTELAQDVRKFVQSGAVYQFSFAYDVLKRRDPTDEEAKSGVTNVLQEVEVFEISVVTVPANQNAIVTDVKRLDASLIVGGTIPGEIKSGRRNSQKDADTIKSAIDGIEKSIESLKSLLKESEEDKPEEEEVIEEEGAPEVNEASEEQKDDANSKRTSDLLEKINQFKGDC